MKRIFSLLAVLLLLPSALHGQSYESLWKQAETARNKDLPESALKCVEQIRQKALREHNDAQFLRAMLSSLVFKEEQTPDSALVLLNRMEESLKAEQRPAEQALWHSALAQAYEKRAWNSWPTDTAAASCSRRHAWAALAHPEVLASASAKDHLPLFIEGQESRIYGNDLLHVLWQTHNTQLSTEAQPLLRRIIALYAQRHLNDAVLCLALDSLRLHFPNHPLKGSMESDSLFAALRSLSQQHAASQWNVLTYQALADMPRDEADSVTRVHNDSTITCLLKEGIQRHGRSQWGNTLRSRLQQLEGPSASLGSLPEEACPGTEVNLYLRARHLQQVTLRITRIYDSQMQARAESSHHSRRAASLRKHSTRQSFALPNRPAYEWQALATTIALPTQPGVYFAELLGEKDEVLDTHTFGITSLRPIVFTTPSHRHRVVVVDNRSGHPVKGATLTQMAYDSQLGRETQVKVFTTDSTGTVLIDDDNRFSNFYAATPSDKASLPFRLGYSGYYDPRAQGSRTTADLFTDRAIYRPGQKIMANVVAYSQQGDHFQVETNLKGKLLLRNANYKIIDSLLVQTDEWGSCAASFQLPASCLNGRFTLQFTDGKSIHTQRPLQVEEYRRPTFTTEVQPTLSAYALGDTTEVEVLAHTYTGIPVAGAKVKWQVTRSAWYGYHSDASNSPREGVAVSDAEGRFRIPVVLLGDAREAKTRPQLARHLFVVKYAVTADNGETVEGSTLLRASNRRSWLEPEMPTVVCRPISASQPALRVHLVNASGSRLDTLIHYSVLSAKGHTMATGEVRTSQPFHPEGWAAWPDGRYVVRFTASNDVLPDTAAFTLISKQMTRPVDANQALFTYEMPSAKKDSLELLVGTPQKQVLLFRDVLAHGELIESRRIELSDSVLHETFAYKEEYGDAADIYYAFLRNGQLFTYHTSVMRPVPDHSLCLKWTSFRSRLTPGQQEVWKLKVLRPDGQPATAQVMAALYDASLDALAPQSWQFSSLRLMRLHTPASWNGNECLATATLSGYARMPEWNTSDFDRAQTDFTHWRSELFEYFPGRNRRTIRINGYGRNTSLRTRKSGRPVMFAEATSQLMAKEAAAPMSDRLEMSTEANNETASLANDGAMGGSEAVIPRSNFAETAFFRPSLHTDATGEVSIDFTLPESTTQWHFLALAHTASMQHALLDTTTVARKEFMVQPFLPRFVRQGDEASLPVQVSNLTSRTLNATLRVELTNALTQRTVWNGRRRITLQPGEVLTETFSFTVPTGTDLLVCRALGSADGFSDGEEHYLPVLSTDVPVTRTLPFTLHGQGTTELRIDTLLSDRAVHPSITVEVTSNPIWTAVNALPALVNANRALSATDWSTRYFAWCVGQKVAQQHPEIGELLAQQPEEASTLGNLNLNALDDLTPWLQQARLESQRSSELKALLDTEAAAARKFTALDHLRALQTTEGGWSWCPGMPANAYITLETTVLLARTQLLTGDTDCQALMLRALNYLKAYMAKQVTEMKQNERLTKHETVPSELHLRYLYLRQLLGMGFSDEADRFLLKRALKLNRELSMQGKAQLALVLQATGHREEAQTLVQSLLEHTVREPEMGRYFDTPRAESTSQNFRLLTQCTTIETLQHFSHPKECDEMRQWLMQSKRTQMWETAQATTEAVYALLGQATSDKVVTPLSETRPVRFTLKSKTKIVGWDASADNASPNSAGYVRRTITGQAAASATTLTLHQPHEGMAWGAVYANSYLPAAEVTTDGHGLNLQCRHEVWMQGKWQPVSASSELHKGDRVRAVYTVTASRDFDFVALRAARPACFQPREALSGYDWQTGLSTYRDVHDSSTAFFLEKVKKGRHTLTEEYFIDRQGRYASGISTLSCVYAPEFHANCSETSFKVTP